MYGSDNEYYFCEEPAAGPIRAQMGYGCDTKRSNTSSTAAALNRMKQKNCRMIGQNRGQVMMEFTFCAAVVLLMLFSLIMVLRWAGSDLAQRRIAHDDSLVQGSPDDGVTDATVPLRQLEPYFYRPIKMNAVWDGR